MKYINPMICNLIIIVTLCICVIHIINMYDMQIHSFFFEEFENPKLFFSMYDGKILYCSGESYGNSSYVEQSIHSSVYKLTGPKILCKGLLLHQLHV